jgi:hypothetical protein
VLHPVGDLAAAVYWRRRLLVLVAVLGVVGGSGGAVLALTNRAGRTAVAEAGSTAARALPGSPALERVVPSPAGGRTPGSSTTSPSAAGGSAAAPAPVAGGPCADAMLSLAVRAPASATVGGAPTFELVVTNTSSVPCVRPVDKSLQELVLLDAAGNRVWDSRDCSPGTSSDTRTLGPGEAVTLSVPWAGGTSEPTCTAPRKAPPAGGYVLRGRLDTLTSSDVPFTLL